MDDVYTKNVSQRRAKVVLTAPPVPMMRIFLMVLILSTSRAPPPRFSKDGLSDLRYGQTNVNRNQIAAWLCERPHAAKNNCSAVSFYQDSQQSRALGHDGMILKHLVWVNCPPC
jgi:hypothetical protein